MCVLFIFSNMEVCGRGGCSSVGRGKIFLYQVVSREEHFSDFFVICVKFMVVRVGIFSFWGEGSKEKTDAKITVNQTSFQYFSYEKTWPLIIHSLLSAMHVMRMHWVVFSDCFVSSCSFIWRSLCVTSCSGRRTVKLVSKGNTLLKLCITDIIVAFFLLLYACVK